MKITKVTLSSKHHRATCLLNLLLSRLRNQLRLNNDRLVLRQNPFPQNLEVPELRYVDQRNIVFASLLFDVFRNQRPELVYVDNGAIKLVAELVEIPHTHFTKISRVVFVEEDPVVVHPSSVSAASGMLSVLPDSTMASAHVAPLLPVLLESGRHFLVNLRVRMSFGWQTAQKRGK